MSKFCTSVLVLVLGLIFFNPIQAQFSYPSVDNVHYHTTAYGMTLAMLKATGENDTEITCYVKVGSVYENDSLSGIASILHQIVTQRVRQALEQHAPGLAGNQVKFQTTATTEHAIFKFVASPTHSGLCLDAIKNAVYLTKITEEDIAEAKDSLALRALQLNNNFQYRMESNILARVYRQDYEKLTVLGNPLEYKNVTLPILLAFYQKYYVVNNSLITAFGNVNVDMLYQQVDDIFADVPKGEFDPESITRMIHYRPMIFTSQMVLEDSIENHEFHICRQFPGINTNLQASYSAYLLCTILNDPNNYIQVKAKKMGATLLVAQYEANNFSSMLRIVLRPPRYNMNEVYDFVVAELDNLEKTIANEGMINAGKLRFKESFEQAKPTRSYLDQVVRYWVFTDESPFPSMADSVWDVSDRKFTAFISEFMNQNPYVAVLLINAADRTALNTDSFFAPLDENIADYTFTYRMNITELEGEANNIRLRNLLQWLRINTDVNIQVNGFSDRGEYDRFHDDSILVFIDSLPTFRRSMPDLIKKGYLRPDMMRAMRIVKYLYDNGISSKRLSGTAMKFSSKSIEEAEENYKVTITPNKMRQSPSLYEQHYGKKRE